MKSVLEYRDYHAFMQDFYDSRKKSGAFSWREFSKNAGFSSSNYLKLVCMGKSKLKCALARLSSKKISTFASYKSNYL